MLKGMRSKICVQVGRRIRTLRKLRGYTQGELARRAEVARESIVVIEKGQRDIGITSLVRIAKALGVTLSEMAKGLE